MRDGSSPLGYSTNTKEALIENAAWRRGKEGVA